MFKVLSLITINGLLMTKKFKKNLLTILRIYILPIIIEISRLILLICNTIHVSKWDGLIQPISNKEILDALNRIGSDKALGPDDLNAISIRLIGHWLGLL